MKNGKEFEFFIKLVAFFAITFFAIRANCQSKDFHTGIQFSYQDGTYQLSRNEPLILENNARIKCDTSIFIKANSELRVRLGEIELGDVLKIYQNDTSVQNAHIYIYKGKVGLLRVDLNNRSSRLELINSEVTSSILIPSIESVFLTKVRCGNFTILCNNIDLFDVKIDSKSVISVRDSIRIFTSGISSGSAKINLYPSDHLNSNSKPLIILLEPESLFDFDFDYSKFNVRSIGPSLDSATYLERILHHQKNLSYEFGIKRSDIELQMFRLEAKGWLGKIRLWIRRSWDNFGYEKELILRNSAYAFCSFLFINLFFFDILFFAYPIPALRPYVEMINRSAHRRWDINHLYSSLPYAIYFTLVVFFGIRMDLSTLKIKRKRLAIYIFSQYVIGLIFLAYLINYFISK